MCPDILNKLHRTVKMYEYGKVVNVVNVKVYCCYDK